MFLYILLLLLDGWLVAWSICCVYSYVFELGVLQKKKKKKRQQGMKKKKKEKHQPRQRVYVDKPGNLLGHASPPRVRSR